MVSDELYERMNDLFESDPADALVCDDVGLSSFFIWLKDRRIGQIQMEHYINSWLETKDGQKFFVRAMERLIDANSGVGRE